MKTAASLTITVVVAVAASVLAARFYHPDSGAAASPPSETGVLERRLAGLEKKLDATEAALREKSVAAAAAPVRLSDEEIDRAIDRRMAAHPPANGTSKSVAAAPADNAVEVASMLSKLSDSKLSREEKRALWKALKDAGLMDAAVSALEQKVKDKPSDAAARLDLAHAYLEKLQTIEDGQTKGKFAMQADQQLDAALEIDPQHWEARFTKAIALSFWPAFTGKQSESIKQFEILVGQQEASGAANPEFAQSYLFLGNLYAQQGQQEKAASVWAKGLKAYPDNASLQEKSGAPAKK